MNLLPQATAKARSNYEVSSNQTGYNQLISNKNGVITNVKLKQDRWWRQVNLPINPQLKGSEKSCLVYLSRQSVPIKVGQPVWVTLWSARRTFAAKVREVSPVADQSRTFTVKVSLLEGQSSIQLGQKRSGILCRK